MIDTGDVQVGQGQNIEITLKAGSGDASIAVGSSSEDIYIYIYTYIDNPNVVLTSTKCVLPNVIIFSRVWIFGFCLLLFWRKVFVLATTIKFSISTLCNCREFFAYMRDNAHTHHARWPAYYALHILAW